MKFKTNIKNCEDKNINITRTFSMIIEREGRMFLDISEMDNELKLSANAVVSYSFIENSICITEYGLEPAGEEILIELIELFQGEEHIIQRWLATPREHFGGKTALDIINNVEGQSLINDFIYRLKTGDFS